MQRVLEITSVDISLVKTKPPQIHVVAHGTVPTSGWKNPELSPWFYIRPPDDGIQDFDFAAEEPDGISLDVITCICAEFTIPADPTDFWGPGKPLVGVRIHARTNSREALFGAAEQAKQAFSIADDDAEPWRALMQKKPALRPISSLIGKSLRVYHTGDPLTKDLRPDRANIELSPSTDLIVQVWFG
jgi:hypothetical protein